MNKLTEQVKNAKLPTDKNNFFVNGVCLFLFVVFLISILLVLYMLEESQENELYIPDDCVKFINSGYCGYLGTEHYVVYLSKDGKIKEYHRRSFGSESVRAYDQNFDSQLRVIEK